MYVSPCSGRQGRCMFLHAHIRPRHTSTHVGRGGIFYTHTHTHTTAGSSVLPSVHAHKYPPIHTRAHSHTQTHTHTHTHTRTHTHTHTHTGGGNIAANGVSTGEHGSRQQILACSTRWVTCSHDKAHHFPSPSLALPLAFSVSRPPVPPCTSTITHSPKSNSLW